MVLWAGLMLVSGVLAQDKEPPQPPPPPEDGPKAPPANLKIETSPGSSPRLYKVKISGTVEGVPDNAVLSVTVKPIVNKYRREDEDVFDEKPGKKEEPGKSNPQAPPPQDPRLPPGQPPMPGQPPVPGQPTVPDQGAPKGPPKATMRTIEIMTEPHYKLPSHYKVIVEKGKFEYEIELGPYVYDYWIRFFRTDQIVDLGEAKEEALKTFGRKGKFLVGDLKLLAQNIQEDSVLLQNHTREVEGAVSSLLAGSTKDGLKKLTASFIAVQEKEGKLTLNASENMFKAIAMEIQIGVHPKNPKATPFATPMEMILADEHRHKDPTSNKDVEEQIERLKDSDFEFSPLHAGECTKVLRQLGEMILRETVVCGVVFTRPGVERCVAVAEEFLAADNEKKKDLEYWGAQLKDLDSGLKEMIALENFLKTRAPMAERYLEVSAKASKPEVGAMLLSCQSLIQTVRDGILNGTGIAADLPTKARENVIEKLAKVEKELRIFRELTPIVPKK
jgi:hypothetical protein